MSYSTVNNENFPEIPGIKTKEGLERAAGNVELYIELLTLFANNHKDFGNKIQKELQDNNQETAERLAHSLKGVSGNLGANGIFILSGSLEKELSKDTWNKEMCQKLLTELLPELDQIIQNIHLFNQNNTL